MGVRFGGRSALGMGLGVGVACYYFHFAHALFLEYGCAFSSVLLCASHFLFSDKLAQLSVSVLMFYISAQSIVD